ncbi:NAC domain-containing protein 71-like [Panicum miliaceum]|uniref:NAC domain-containing protein 71-like n=1 Tax=Panicum miliaceum TaxID=4540 RepID=A0A3L6T6M5_PANMI|nr:NAC domain-containing protein 71-like [Panicum miliaceum]
MQQPFFNGDASRRAGGAAAPRGPPYNGHPYQQRSSLTPAADGRGGAANAGNGAARLNVDAEQYFVDLVTINPSLAGGCMQLLPAPTPLAESPAPAAAGAAEVETRRGQRLA